MVKEDILWLKLTGMPKGKSDLGEYPFKLLCHIAKARAEGITSSKLAKDTKQDSRSITGRLNLLIKLGLIKKYPIISNGSWTYISVYRKFTWVHRNSSKKPATNGNKEKGGPKSKLLDKKLIRRKIVESCKLAPNGIRFFLDMVEEFSVDRVRLVNLFRRLTDEGYIEQLIMCREDAPARKFICAKFVKDLPLSDDPDEEENDEDEEGDYAEDDESEGMDVPGENVLPSDLSEMQQVSLTDSSRRISQLANHTFNMIYTLSHQIFHLVNASASAGVPGGVVLNELTGRGYFRVIGRELDLLAGNLSSKDLKKYTDTPIGHLLVVRGVDFSARIKYYRYFSNTGYAAFSGISPNPIWGGFFQGERKYDTLAAMEKARYTPLPGRANIITENGRSEVVFYGGIVAARKKGIELPIPDIQPSTGKKRGRPRKNAASSTPSKKRKTNNTQDGDSMVENVEEVSVANSGKPDSQGDASFSTEVGNLVATSETQDSQHTPSQEVSGSNHGTLAPETAIAALQNAGSWSEQISQNDSLALVDPLIQQTRPKSPDKETDVTIESSQDLPPPPEFKPINLMETKPMISEISEISEDVEMIDNAPSTVPAIVSSTPSSKEKRTLSRWKPPPKTKAFDFGDQKRNKRVLDVLDSFNGVYEHGVEFLRVYNERYREENNSTMDKKTYDKCIRALTDEDEVRVIRITFPHMSRQGSIHITKSLVLRADIANDDYRVTDAKTRLRESLENQKRRPPHSITRKSESGNFMVVTDKYKDLIQKSSNRHLKITTRLRETAATDRLKKADKALRSSRVRGPRRIKEKGDGNLAIDMDEADIDIDEMDVDIDTRLSSNKESRKRRSKKKSGSDASHDDIPAKHSGKRKKRSQNLDLPEGEDPLVMRTPNTSMKIIRTSLKRRSQIFNPVARSLELDKSVREGEFSRPNVSRVGQGRLKLNLIVKDMGIFYRVIIICRAFTDAKYLKFDWVQITRELKYWYPEVTEDEAKRIWSRGRTKLGGMKFIENLTESWIKIFERGYANGEIKLMDPDDLDIPYLVDYWVQQSPMLKDPDGSPMLYESREEFEKEYIVVPQKYTSNHDAVLSIGKSMAAMDDMLANWAMAAPRTKTEAGQSYNEDVAKAKTSIKALIATPEQQYDAAVARDLLLQYSDNTINRAMKELDAEKSIIYVARDVQKVRPGRNFMFSDKFMSSITLRVEQNFMYSVSKFYETLRSTFGQNKGLLFSGYIKDHAIPCVVDLISTNQADVVCIKSQTKTDDSTSSRRKGSTIGNRRINYSKHDFDLVMRSHVDPESSSASSSLESYQASTQYGPENPRPSSITRISRPHISYPMGAPGEYIWIGVKGLLSFPIFERLVFWIIMHLTNHPGDIAENIWSILDPVLSLNEVRVLLKWLQDRRIVKPTPCNGFKLLGGWYFNTFN